MNDSSHRQRLGRWGEQLATDHLAANGYAILARNWRGPGGELDLVAQDGEVVVIVEVKTRRGAAHGVPEEALTPRKAMKLRQLGASYVAAHCPEDTPWRIDLVAVELDRNGRLMRCEQIEHAVMGW